MAKVEPRERPEGKAWDDASPGGRDADNSVALASTVVLAAAVDGDSKVRATKPRGRPPKGKVWDDASGGWVADTSVEFLSSLPAASADDDSKMRPTKPRGRPPKGKVWDDASGGWVADPSIEFVPSLLAAVVNDESKKPRGRPPKGKVWDYEFGGWVHGVPSEMQQHPAKKAKTAHYDWLLMEDTSPSPYVYSDLDIHELKSRTVTRELSRHKSQQEAIAAAVLARECDEQFVGWAEEFYGENAEPPFDAMDGENYDEDEFRSYYLVSPADQAKEAAERKAAAKSAIQAKPPLAPSKTDTANSPRGTFGEDAPASKPPAFHSEGNE